MSDWSLQSARRAAHSLGVWFAWVVLTGRLTHDKTYGDLKRLTPAEVARQVALLVLTLAVVGYVVLNIPPGAAFWVGWGLVIATAIGGVVVGGYLAVAWYIDYSLSR